MLNSLPSLAAHHRLYGSRVIPLLLHCWHELREQHLSFPLPRLKLCGPEVALEELHDVLKLLAHRGREPVGEESGKELPDQLANLPELFAYGAGFTGEPRTSPTAGRYYGYLTHVEGY